MIIIKILTPVVRSLAWVVSLFYGLRVNYLFYLLSRIYVTQLYARTFKEFGSKSMLAPSVRLIKPQCISIGKSSSIMKGCVLEACIGEYDLDFKIGSCVSLGEYSHVTCTRKVVIGNNVLTGRYVLITDNSHGESKKEILDQPPLTRKVYSKGEVIIEDNVWIGDKASILPGVHIGKGCIIGANSVVTKDVPPNAVVAGNPAKIIKQF